MILYNGSQVENISGALKLSKRDVSLILHNYRYYLEERLREGKTVKVLNICYIRNVENADEYEHETLAYIATEVARSTGVGTETVLRVLQTLEEMLIRDIAHGERYCLRGLIRLKTEETPEGLKVRVGKSHVYSGMSNRVVILGSFKRKVAAVNAR